MTNNRDDYPSSEEQARVLDSTHGIEHVKEGYEHAYYPWHVDENGRAVYYMVDDTPGPARIGAFKRVRFTSYGLAFNYIAEQRGLPGLPYPIVP